MQASRKTVEYALQAAWRLAAEPGQDRYWRTRLWPLIFRIETALLNGERDLLAEAALVALVHANDDVVVDRED